MIVMSYNLGRFVFAYSIYPPITVKTVTCGVTNLFWVY